MKRYSVSNVIYYNDSVGSAGVIVKDEETKKEVAMTYEEAEVIYQEHGFTNAYIRKIYREDYGKEIVSIQPKKKDGRFSFVYNKIIARGFYKKPHCEMSEKFKKLLDDYFSVHTYGGNRTGTKIIGYELAQIVRDDFFVKGMKRKDIAKKHNISRPSISNILNNEIYVQLD